MQSFTDDLRQALARLDPRAAPQVVLVRRAPWGITAPHQRLGVFSASFNPPHNAHVEMMRLAQQKFNLDEMLLLLAKANVDKEEFGATLEQRLTMMLGIAAEHPDYSVAAVSHGRFVDKAIALREVYPDGTAIYFLLGYDTLVRLFDPKYYADMPTELTRLFSMAQFIAANRQEHGIEEIRQLLMRAEVRPFAHQIHPLALDDVHAHLSSTEVRRRVAAHEPYEHLVPPTVAAFIRQAKLYLFPA
ncbi:MAG: nicotinate-nicotinamide nucleotide adenylyltransferase [Abditibacteriales bacterium]|nr:nicotinate-nicotinamide nucleotide adenylyltransferase [Abditibacteriales bacterium]MDW8365488.1 nicotinate-nicotinamide nucleotide adenylyltransferase [Abditibacteriales bacterium]